MSFLSNRNVPLVLVISNLSINVFLCTDRTRDLWRNSLVFNQYAFVLRKLNLQKFKYIKFNHTSIDNCKEKHCNSFYYIFLNATINYKIPIEKEHL
jgi:hypothetical protein